MGVGQKIRQKWKRLFGKAGPQNSAEPNPQTASGPGHGNYEADLESAVLASKIIMPDNVSTIEDFRICADSSVGELIDLIKMENSAYADKPKESFDLILVDASGNEQTLPQTQLTNTFMRDLNADAYLKLVFKKQEVAGGQPSLDDLGIKRKARK